MSKCDISIELENPDSTFHSGETINGTVTIAVNKNVNCRALKIAGYWKTHGRGNRDSGRYGEKIVYEGDLQAGETQTYPFSIPIEDRLPLTYHGKLINIDHYVDVRVDIPWGFDPKERKEIIVLPGSEGNLTEPKQPDPHATGLMIGRAAGGIVAVILCLFGILTIPFCVGFPILAVGLVVGFFSFRKLLAEQRVGDVEVVVDSAVIAPSDSLPITVNFTPRKAGKINEIAATLTATETAVSGSGTNKSTHTNNLYKLPFNLKIPTSFQAHQQVSCSGTIAIPDTDAYTFDTGDNEVSWSLKVKIDIPMWPDWLQDVHLRLVPRERLHRDESSREEPVEETAAADQEANLEEEPIATQAATVATAVESTPETAKAAAEQEEPVTPEAPASDPTSPAETAPAEPAPAEPAPAEPAPAEPAPAEPAPPEPAPPEPAPPEPAPVEVTVSLEETCNILNDSGQSTADQARILEAVADQTFELTLTIERVSSTYSWDKNSQYNDGKTIMGILEGTEHQVQILLPSDRNDEVSQLKEGDRWTGTGRITGRDSLFRRIEMNGN